ncbi:MAG: HlyD family efflux transporter periplasmic adaptor subunit [Hydrogenophaga sp.]|nr:HlyD family efflux transporter periplasmic adaptor subunit [Hydrogenophaga sp.]
MSARPMIEPAGPVAAAPLPANPLIVLLDLARRARRAASVPELRFMAVNDSHALAPYRQAALWFSGMGVQALSGIVQIEANAPYTLWLGKLCAHLSGRGDQPLRLTAGDVPDELAQAWAEWLPQHLLWVPLPGGELPQAPAGGLLLARDQPWADEELALLGEWMDGWHLAWRAQFRPPAYSVRTWPARAVRYFRPAPDARWWRHKPALLLAASVLLVFLPVRLTVLAPGELVPARPAVIRAPLDGVVEVFHVQPNQAVRQGDPLFGFDEGLILSKLEVARQSLATAQAEYQQMAQLALSDSKARGQLAVLTGKIEERRAEALYIEDQLNRARVLAPQDGIAIFDDPSEWLGKPVAVGERILRIASPNDVEVEAWVSVADAIPVDPAAGIRLYLSASPMDPVEATVRYFSHDAILRPDGSYAYRLRATLDEPTLHRVGLKGTAKVRGEWVPMAYWALRRPWASVRSTLGW